MRQAVFAVVLVGAAFLGGATVNGPGVRWVQARLLDYLGIKEGGEIASIDAPRPPEEPSAGQRPAPAPNSGQKGVPPPTEGKSGSGHAGSKNEPAREAAGPSTAGSLKAGLVGFLANLGDPAKKAGPSEKAVPERPEGAQAPDAASPPGEKAGNAAPAPPSSQPAPASNAEAPRPLPLPVPAAPGDPAAASPAPLDPEIGAALLASRSPIGPASSAPKDPEPSGSIPLEVAPAAAGLDDAGSRGPSAGPAPAPGVGSSTGSPPDWAGVRRKLQTLGVSRYTIEGQPTGRVSFSCLIPLAGRQAVSQRFEAEGDDELQAARAAIRRIALWRATRPSPPPSP
jgi:hypothetical protein